MARVESHVSAYKSTLLLTPERPSRPGKYTASLHRPLYHESKALQANTYLRLSRRVARKFPTFSSSSSFFFFIFFFFFLSHSPSALRKQGTVLIFTQNVTTGDGGVHRPQAIDSSLLYETRANRGFLEFM